MSDSGRWLALFITAGLVLQLLNQQTFENPYVPLTVASKTTSDMPSSSDASDLCEPSSSCLSSVLEFVRSSRKGFFVGRASKDGDKRSPLKLLTEMLPKIAASTLSRLHGDGSRPFPAGRSERFYTWPTLIDVGAAAYSREFRSPDGSDALLMLHVFGGNCTIHAFEAQHEKAEELERLGSKMSETKHPTHSHSLIVHAAGVGKQKGELKILNKNKWKNTARLADENGQASDGLGGSAVNGGKTVPVVALDDLFQKTGAFYVKIDVEGGERNVLLGMNKLLESGMVDLISVEYANQWSPEFSDTKSHPIPMSEYKGPSLKELAARMASIGVGYDTYLLHKDESSKRVTLVPVYGKFWRDELEICLNTPLYQQPWCWNDLLLVRREQPALKAALMDVVLNSSLTSPSLTSPPSFLELCDC